MCVKADMQHIDEQAIIRVGLVGVGNWGRYGHIPVLQLLPNFEIAAVASRRKEIRLDLAKNTQIAEIRPETGDNESPRVTGREGKPRKLSYQTRIPLHHRV